MSEAAKKTVFVSRLATSGHRQLLIIPKDKYFPKKYHGRQVMVTLEFI